MIEVGLALPFSLGIATAINPCGLAMLPPWLGYFIGRNTADQEARPEQVVRGLWVSLLLTVSFVAVFGLLGRDTEGWFTTALGAVGLPVTGFVDRSGALAHVHHGPIDPDDLEAAIAEHLS